MRWWAVPVVLALAACSSGGDDASSRDTTSTTSTTVSETMAELAPVFASSGLPGVTEAGLSSAFTTLGLSCDAPSSTLAGTMFDCKRENGTLLVDVAVSTNTEGRVWAASVNISDIDPEVLHATAVELMPSAAGALAAGSDQRSEVVRWIADAVGFDGSIELADGYWTMVSRQRLIFFTVEAADIPGHVPPQPLTAPTTAAPAAATTTAPAVESDPHVPDVTGLAPEEAANMLGRAGFDAAFAEEPSDTIEEGRVTRTDPPAGSEAARGATVTVYVSTGTTTVAVPDVIGLAEPEAVTQLQQAGFRVVRSSAAVSDPVNDGVVIDQSPEGGVQAEQGSTVQIVVGQYMGG